MRRSREETAETRRQILGTASQLFRARGIAPVSVADIMGSIDLTVGGFYRHFESKEALVTEAIAAASDETRSRYLERGADAKGAFEFLEEYLSKGHRDQPAIGCPVAALCSEVGHESLPTKQAFTQALHRLLEIIDTLEPGETKDARDGRLFKAAAIVGAVALSRATSDEALADELLRAARRGALGDAPKRTNSRRSGRETTQSLRMK